VLVRELIRAFTSHHSPERLSDMGSYSNHEASCEEIMHSVDLDGIESNFIGDPMDPVWGDIMGDVSSAPPRLKKARRMKPTYTLEKEAEVREVNRLSAHKSRDKMKELRRLQEQETEELLVELEELKAFKAATVDYMSNNDMDTKFLTLVELLSDADTGL
jgi:hypothetical protein